MTVWRRRRGHPFVSTGGSAAPPAGTHNATTANTNNLRRAINAVINGTANARISCLGDSLTAGQGSNGTTNPGSRLLSYPTALASKMATGFGVRAQADNWFGSTNLTSVTYPQYDPRWTMSTGAWSSTAFSVGGPMYVAANNTSTPTFTPFNQFDRVDYVLADRGGGINLIADAQSAVTVATVGVNSLLTGTANMAALATTLKYQGATASGIQLIGTQTWDSSISQIMVHNMGWRGVLTGALTPNPSSNTWDGYKAINAINPDAVIMNLGTNDMAVTGGQTLPNFIIQYPRLISQMHDAATDVIALIPQYQASSDVDGVSGQPTLANIQLYNQAMRDACIAQGVPYIDSTQIPGLESYAIANAGGYMYDKIHLNGNGYALQATYIHMFIGYIMGI